MDRSVPSYMHFWGKAGGERWHPLVFHMLDVAAVAREVLEREPESTKRRASRLFLSEKEFSDSISFLAAMHDLAKFSKDFQWKIPELATQLSGENPVRITASHHTTFAWGIWKKVARPFLVEKYPAFGKSNESDWLNPLLTASFGHHGVPTDYRIQSPDYTNSFFNQLIADQEIVAIKTFLLDLLDLFPGARVIFESPEMLTKNRHEWNVFSFYLSGLIVLADWTASSELNFHYYYSFEQTVATPFALEEYWKKSQSNAKEAIEKQGLGAVEPSHFTNLWDELILKDAEHRFEPSPLQRVLLTQKLPESPSLYIIEDIAGAGKTEAALVLFARLMERGGANSLFFALPTMATSNGIYSRLAKVYKRFYAPDTNPSLILAHGGRGLHHDYQKSIRRILPEIQKNTVIHTWDQADESRDEEDISSSAACNEWLADNSKKTFLAQVGVGSIDQALLTVMYSKHYTLRMYGLSHSILLVDEVHAYDDYMQSILKGLVQFLAMQGRPVILLSATLPNFIKKELMIAYILGREFVKKENHYIDLDELQERLQEKMDGYSFSDAYPLLSISNDSEIMEIPLASQERLKRTFRVEFQREESDVIELLKKCAESGNCGVWIRNTVGEVQRSYEELVRILGADRVLIFHSRYTMEDRQIHEEEVLATFGRDSNSANRSGKILLASQVVEQSLDLDFDAMVSDLAPIDLLIQRAGRLQRHVRNANGDPAEREERPAPVLHIHGPDPDENQTEGWFREFSNNDSSLF